MNQPTDNKNFGCSKKTISRLAIPFGVVLGSGISAITGQWTLWLPIGLGLGMAICLGMRGGS